jgi:hypothetical protein
VVSIWKIILRNSETDEEAYIALVKVVTNKGLVCGEICYVLEKGNVNFSVMIFPYK